MAAASVAVVLALLVAPASAGAGAATQAVDVQFDALSPSQLDLLPGESVTWSNVSPRVHTVTSDSGLFDAGELGPGATFARAFDEPGAYAYHCTIHAGMIGEVDIRRVILGLLPTAVVPAGEHVEFSGRTADVTRPVSIQRSVVGGAFATVASASPAPDGSWRATVAAELTSDFRAASGGDVSQTRRLLVSERRVRLRKTRRGVTVTVTPSVPYARIMLQADLHERFGWWPIARAKLDYLSQASFRVHRPARVRAVLVAKDGWTPLATSPVVVLGHAKPTHMGGMHMHAVMRQLS
ncbi:MAG TPA: plastocyanin/azurin family copper-binding protein [Conexibacter sp.]|nr:plastocyanin/azurin family copper-binding protein [Conexibacter sp.]